MKKRILSISLLSLLIVSGCSNTTGRSVSVSQSGFDGAKVVTIKPHGNACTSVVCTGLGAQWSSSDPEDVILLVNVFNEIRGITGAALNIDGKVYNLKKSDQFTNFDSWSPSIRNSEQPFITNLSIIKEIISSKRTWLRVTTTNGYLEDAVVDGSKDSKALHALRRFMAQVDNK